MVELSAITPYSRSVGSSRVRVFEWFDRLGLDDRTVTSLSIGGSADPGSRRQLVVNHLRALRQLRRNGSTLVHREASLVGPWAIPARGSNRVIFDIDDALFADTSPSRRSRVAGYAAQADVLLCGNQYLADWASQFNGTIVPMPSCVDPSAYQRKTNYEISSPPRIVWLGSWSTEAFLLDIGPALDELHARFKSRLIVIGSKESGELERRFHGYLERVPWSIEAQAQVLRTADVGIMPVPDSAFTRGKCAYKLLQYGSAGLPLVGSPVGANEQFLARCDAAAPTTQDEWIDALGAIFLASAAERTSMGDRAHDVVVSGYSFSAHEAAWGSAVLSR